MTPQDMSPQELVSTIVSYLEQELADGPPIKATLKFVHPDGGAILIDGLGSENQVSLSDTAADCVVTLSLMTHLQMLRFELDQAMAFREGRLRIKGNIAVALRLGPLISKPLRLPGEDR